MNVVTTMPPNLGEHPTFSVQLPGLQSLPRRVSEASSQGHTSLRSDLVSPGLQFPMLSLDSHNETVSPRSRRESDRRDAWELDDPDIDRPPSKRLRIDPDPFEPDFNWVWPISPSSASGPSISSMPPPTSTPKEIGASTPGSDNAPTPGSSHMPSPTTNPDIRRLSVSSLLSPGHVEGDRRTSANHPQIGTVARHLHSTTFYGIDRGFRDLDIGRNDDWNAISGVTPQISRGSGPNDTPDNEEDQFDTSFGNYKGEFERDAGSYYNKPVMIRIPRSLEPLPSKLVGQPMNILVCLYTWVQLHHLD